MLLRRAEVAFDRSLAGPDSATPPQSVSVPFMESPLATPEQTSEHVAMYGRIGSLLPIDLSRTKVRRIVAPIHSCI